MFKKLLFRLYISTHVFLYQITNGRIGGEMSGMSILLLSTTGRRTGKKRTVPLSYMEDGENFVVVGSNAGRDFHPAWYLNLKTEPKAVVQVKDEVLAIEAKQANEGEKRRIWPDLVEFAPAYQDYQQKNARDIPIMILHPDDD